MQESIKIKNLEKKQKIDLLYKATRDYINVEAVFSDETENFVSPAEPTYEDNIKVKIRVYKDNIDEVYIHINEMVLPLQYEYSEGLFDFYTIILQPIKNQIKYYFSLKKDNNIFYYNKRGLYSDVDHIYDFSVIPNFKTPDWAKGATMYQIYVDRFYNGDKTNDVVNNEYVYLGRIAKKSENWNEPVNCDDVGNFYGGDLQGVIDKMKYLQELGVQVIYFNPVFVSPSNHKYDTQDYDYIDPHYGVILEDGGEPLPNNKLLNRFASMYLKRTTDKINLEASNRLMIRLIKVAHEHGIKIILDGVFNHCGAFNKWLDKEGFYNQSGYPVGAYREQTSIYHNYFRWYDNNWPNNDCYDSWWGHDNHPKLNFEGSEELYNYILEIGKKWVSEPFCADGWRLDVAADLGHSSEFNHKFWHDFRKAVKEANPNAIILGEHYGDPKDWLQGDQWDTVMNYDAFMEPLTWFLTGMEKHSEQFKPEMLCNAMAFENSMRYYMSRFTYQSLYCSMNQLSNHDHSRFLTRTNRTAGRLHTSGREAASINTNLSVMMEAVVFQMTWPGAPTLYYGDEVGLEGWTDPDNRRPFPWGKENKLLLEFHRKIIKLRKKSKAILKGSVEFLYSNYGVLSFARWFEDESVVIILNNNDVDKSLSIPVWRANMNKDCNAYQIIATADENYFWDNRKFIVKDGQLKVNMPPFSSIVVSNKIF